MNEYECVCVYVGVEFGEGFVFVCGRACHRAVCVSAAGGVSTIFSFPV